MENFIKDQLVEAFQILKRQGISQTDVAEKIGCDPARITEAKKGYNISAMNYVSRGLIDHFGFKEEYFFPKPKDYYLLLKEEIEEIKEKDLQEIKSQLTEILNRLTDKDTPP
jgi:transcriptional regulator with XRE-family HTH domain